MNNSNDITLKDYIDKVASSAGTPGGGNVISTVNSLAASLMLMSLRIVILKKNSASKSGLELEKELIVIKEESLELAEADSREFKEVMKNWSGGGHRLEESLKGAAMVSLEIARKAVGLIELIEAQDLDVYKNIITDVTISFRLAESAFHGGIANCIINAGALSKEKNKAEILKLQNDIEKRYARIANRLTGKLDLIIKR